MSAPLPPCPICGCAPPTYESAPGEWVTRCHGEYHRLTVLGDSKKEANENWRRLAAPHPMPPEVVALLRVVDHARDCDEEECAICNEDNGTKVREAWIAAGRPGLPSASEEEREGK